MRVVRLIQPSLIGNVTRGSTADVGARLRFDVSRHDAQPCHEPERAAVGAAQRMSSLTRKYEGCAGRCALLQRADSKEPPDAK